MDFMKRNAFSLSPAFFLVIILLPALVSIFKQANVAHAATLTVTIFHDENDGTCDASCSIRDAIAQGTNGDDITIPPGTYTLSATNGSLTVSENLIFNGASASNTFIDAQGGSRVFNVTGGSVTLNQLTLQNGVQTNGAGLFISGLNTNVMLNNAVVISNTASGSGGGVYVQSGTLNLQNSDVVSNTAAFDGGGIYSHRGTITSSSSQISYNVALRGGGVHVNQDSATFTLNSGEISYNQGSQVVDSFPGGGIFVGTGQVILNGGEVKFNSAYRGGGILVSSGHATLNNAQIISNTATYGGGAYVVNTSGWFTQTAGTIAYNNATGPNDFGGGGLYIFNGSAALLGGEVVTNTAASHGGGLEVRFGSLTLNGATISGNQAGHMGGAIYNSGGLATIHNSLISHNTAADGGGGLTTGYDSGPSQTLIENSTFLNNSTPTNMDGGGILATGQSTTTGGVITLTNVTLSGNGAGGGAGMANEQGSTAVLTNVTIADNSANNNGGGLSNGSGGTLTVGNSIIFGNSAASGANCSGMITSAGHNISTCGLSASGDISSDPLLEPLALNDGSTLNYALADGSPARDGGSNTLCPAADQRGNLRPIDGDGDNTSVCDIGSYEHGLGFFISDASLTEGDAGSAQLSFVVSRSFITSTTTTVDYATVDGTAVAGADYTAVPTTTLTFLPATITQTVTVDILGDTLDEIDEQFTVILENQSAGVLVGDFSGAATILDDDDPPSLTFADASAVLEGNTGTATAVFTATLSAPSGKTITVDYETVDGTAVANSDYEAASSTITFNPGETEQTVSITINGDLLDEEDSEMFSVALSNASNVTLADTSAAGTILDDDPLPSLSIADASVTEGNSGTTTMNLLVSLDAPSGKTITVTYATSAGTATAGVDYVATSGSLTFTPGDTQETVSVTINGDTIDEVNETFLVTLSAPTNATLDDAEATGTITDDDPQPTASINDVSVEEGDSGTVTAVFTVTLSAPSTKIITINYSSSNGTAVAGEDFSAVAPATLTFNPGGPLSQTISVTIQGDEETEPDEQFFINLSGASNVTLVKSQGIGTIRNDDGHFLYLPFIVKP